MIIAITGYRKFTKYEKFEKELNDFINKNSIKISKMVFGDCKGTDLLAYNYCEKYHIPFQMYYADWKRQGKAAGPLRNIEMINSEKPDFLIAFLNSESKGTKQCVEYAKTKGINTYIVEV